MLSKLDVVVYLHNGIGDLVMAFPLLEALREPARSGQRILIWVKCPVTLCLMRQVGYTDLFEVRILNRRLAPLQALALRLRRVETVLAPQACGDWRMPFMAWLTGAAVRVGRENPLGRWGFNRVLPHYDRQQMHKSRFYLKVAEAVGYTVSTDPRLPRLAPSAALADKWRKRLGLGAGEVLVGLAPGSSLGEVHKRWPVGHYARYTALALVRHSHWRIALFGGPEERSMLDDIRRQAGATVAERIAVVAEGDLENALAAFAQAACLVANCNGPAHLAALMGVPLVGLYGPTNAGNTAPFTPDFRFVSLGFACSPCYRHEFLRGCGEPDCMREITPERVLQETELSLSGNRGTWAAWRNTTAVTNQQRTGIVSYYGY